MSDSNNNSEDKILFCSFCGKNQNEVRKLIAGPSVYICNECIDLCNDIIQEELSETNDPEEQKDFLISRPNIDFYIVGEGEEPFVALLNELFTYNNNLQIKNQIDKIDDITMIQIFK